MDGTPNDVDSFHITIVNPPNPDIVLGVRIAPGQDTIRLRLELDLSSPATVTVNFEGWSTATGLRLYSGTQTVNVAPGQQSNPSPVQAAYVGPGASVDSVVVAPPSATLLPSATAQLTYTGFDNNASLPDDSVPVWYQSSDSGVARVSRSGLVTAIAAGTANILVTTLANRSVRGTSAITVSTTPQPAIGLSVTSVVVQDTVSTTDPAPRTVTISNAGGGSLAGLSIGSIQFSPGAAGWVTTQLSGTTAPATLTLNFSNGGFQPGTYTATIPIIAPAASNSPQNISVTYNLTAAGPATLKLTPGYLATQPGGTVTLAVDVRDANNVVLPSSGTTFVSRSPAVATVNPTTGQVTAVAAGHAVIAASLSGVGDSIVVSVAANGSVILSANGDGRAFDRVSVGDTVRVTVSMFTAPVAPELLGSYNVQLNYSNAVLTFVRADPVPGGFASPTVNSTVAGQLQFAAIDAVGHAGPSIGLVNLIFVASAAGTSPITRIIRAQDDISASVTFTNLLPAALFHTGTVRVQ